eukprot:7091075-Prymnesium_polylepis.2
MGSTQRALRLRRALASAHAALARRKGANACAVSRTRPVSCTCCAGSGSTASIFASNCRAHTVTGGDWRCDGRRCGGGRCIEAGDAMAGVGWCE